MKSDYWTDDGLFHHMGKAYGLNKNCQTVVVSQNADEPSLDDSHPIEKTSGDTLNTPRELCPKRGPKFQALPDDAIKQLSLSGLSSRGIAEKLNSEGHRTSYKTIQRRLAGVRQ